MYYSRYNVIVDLDHQPEQSVIQNIFHGRASMISRSLAEKLRCKTMTRDLPAALAAETLHVLKDKGFIYDDRREEDELIAKTFKAFKSGLPTANPIRQYQIVLTYDCNLRCVYCFQKEVRKRARPGYNITEAQLARIFEVIDDCEDRNEKEIAERCLKSRVPLIQIVGGEPLADDDDVLGLVRRIVTYARDKEFQYSITTNGVHLADYLAVFDDIGHRPRDTQVTVDGPKAYHDKRRFAIGGGGSFDQIARSVDNALSAGLRISLRINTDVMNIDNIPTLASFMVDRGWTDYPEFSAYIAPVTDHSAVNGNYKWLPSPSELIDKLVAMFRANPEMASIFTMKNFRGYEYVRRTLQDEGIQTPTMWRCEAVLGQYVFDPFGGLYTCFEGAGNGQARIGSYFPEFKIDVESKQAWDRLNAVENPVCGECRYRFVCTSGCPLATINDGKTECLPIEQEMALAWNYLGRDVSAR